MGHLFHTGLEDVYFTSFCHEASRRAHVISANPTYRRQRRGELPSLKGADDDDTALGWPRKLEVFDMRGRSGPLRSLSPQFQPEICWTPSLKSPLFHARSTAKLTPCSKTGGGEGGGKFEDRGHSPWLGVAISSRVHRQLLRNR